VRFVRDKSVLIRSLMGQSNVIVYEYSLLESTSRNHYVVSVVASVGIPEMNVTHRLIDVDQILRKNLSLLEALLGRSEHVGVLDSQHNVVEASADESSILGPQRIGHREAAVAGKGSYVVAGGVLTGPSLHQKTSTGDSGAARVSVPNVRGVVRNGYRFPRHVYFTSGTLLGLGIQHEHDLTVMVVDDVEGVQFSAVLDELYGTCTEVLAIVAETTVRDRVVKLGGVFRQ